jgi:hypothetical protein
VASQSPSMPASTTGAGGGGDCRPPRQDHGQPVGVGGRCATEPSFSPGSCSCSRAGGPAREARSPP